METKTKTNALKDYLEELTVVDYYEKRKEIIAKCKINNQIFRNWKNGITPVPELAKPIINQIANYEVFKLEEL